MSKHRMKATVAVDRINNAVDREVEIGTYSSRSNFASVAGIGNSVMTRLAKGFPPGLATLAVIAHRLDTKVDFFIDLKRKRKDSR